METGPGGDRAPGDAVRMELPLPGHRRWPTSSQRSWRWATSLVRDFNRNVRLALIAYNACPQHARAVQAGRAVAYRETRAYLDAISARYPLP